MEAIVSLVILVLTVTFVLWCLCISNKRIVKMILVINGVVFFLYIMAAVIAGDESCCSEWLCFRSQHYALIMIVIHATLFECFMLLHLLVEKVVKRKKNEGEQF